MENKILYIDATDFCGNPTGGTSTFASNMLSVFHKNMKCIGFANEKCQQKYKWSTFRRNGLEVEYMAFGFICDENWLTKLIPKRLIVMLNILPIIPTINNDSAKTIFTRTPEIAISLLFSKNKNLVFCFAGQSNSVEISKFPLLRKLSFLYEKILKYTLNRKFKKVYVSGDKKSVEQINSVFFDGKNFSQQLTTKVDLQIFKPNKENLTHKTYQNKKFEMVCVGKITQVKGHKFLILVVRHLRSKGFACKVTFVGKGELMNHLIDNNADLIEDGTVEFVGNKTKLEISNILNRADLYICGSFHEGYSNAMLEALAVGRNIVATAVGGANEMVFHGLNGYICDKRSVTQYAELVSKAYKTLPRLNYHSLKIAKRHDISTLADDLKMI